MVPKKIFVVNPIPKRVVLQPKPIIQPKIIIQKPSTSTSGINATVETASKATNTELTMKQIKVSKEKTIYQNEGFKTYYDHVNYFIYFILHVICNYYLF
jgi:hypothetical protein